MPDAPFAFIGAGAVANGFAELLQRHGVHVAGFFSRGPSARETAGRLNTAVFSSPSEAVRNGRWIAIATPDDAIRQVVEDIAGHLNESHVLVHFSGAHPASILKPPGSSWQAVSLHPLASVAGPDGAADRLIGCWYAVDGDPPAVDEAARLIEALGSRTFRIAPEKRALYHAGACVASNYLCTLAQAASELLMAAGVSSEEAVPALMPLIRGTVQNIANRGLPAALTGPVARGDVQTIRLHLDRMAHDAPHWLALYCLLGRYTTDIRPHPGVRDLFEDPT